MVQGKGRRQRTAGRRQKGNRLKRPRQTHWQRRLHLPRPVPSGPSGQRRFGWLAAPAAATTTAVAAEAEAAAATSSLLANLLWQSSWLRCNAPQSARVCQVIWANTTKKNVERGNVERQSKCINCLPWYWYCVFSLPSPPPPPLSTHPSRCVLLSVCLSHCATASNCECERASKCHSYGGMSSALLPFFFLHFLLFFLSFLPLANQ